MKFVDEATVKVQAGNGGPRRVSFRREKFVPFGGPDGGDGGARRQRLAARAARASTRWRTSASSAPSARRTASPAAASDCTGRGGEDLYVPMPVGTVVLDADTGETLGDLDEGRADAAGRAGGKGGWGNQRFKISTNRTPRQCGPGLPGEKRELRARAQGASPTSAC